MGTYVFRTHQAPRLYAELDRERCGRYVIQFRSCSAWRLALRRAPALELPSHEPTQWGHRDKPAQVTLQRPVEALTPWRV
jgi:hypothetical protein